CRAWSSPGASRASERWHSRQQPVPVSGHRESSSGRRVGAPFDPGRGHRRVGITAEALGLAASVHSFAVWRSSLTVVLTPTFEWERYLPGARTRNVFTT